MSLHRRQAHARPFSEVETVEERRLVPSVVAALCAGELLLVFGNLAAGAFFESLMLGVILYLQAVKGGQVEGRSLAVLALVPLLRLLSLTTPLPGVPAVYWLALAGVPLIVAGVIAGRAVGLSPADLGLGRPRGLIQLVVALTGLPLGLLFWLWVEPSSPIADGRPMVEYVAVAIVLAAFVGVLEEFIFRGIIQAGLSIAYANGAVVLSTILYGATYLGTLSLVGVAFATLLGLAYGLAVQRTGSIVGAAASHALVAVGGYLVWPALLG